MTRLSSTILLCSFLLFGLLFAGCPGRSTPVDEKSVESDQSNTTDNASATNPPTEQKSASDTVEVPTSEGPHNVGQPARLQMPTRTQPQRGSGGSLMFPSEHPPSSFKLGVGGLEPPTLKPLELPPGTTMPGTAGHPGARTGEDSP